MLRALAAVLLLAGPALAASRVQPDLGALTREAIDALPESFRNAAGYYAAYGNLETLKELSGMAAEYAATGKTAPRTWYGQPDVSLFVQRTSAAAEHPDKAARELMKLSIALEPVLLADARARERFGAAWSAAKSRVPSMSYDQLRRQISAFMAENGLRAGLEAEAAAKAGVESLHARGARLKRPERKVVSLHRREPPAPRWIETRFGASEPWAEGARVEAPAADAPAWPEGDTVAALPALSLARTTAFFERLPRAGPVRGPLRKRYVLLDGPQAGPVVNLDPEVFLILGPSFSSSEGVFSKGRVLVAGAATEGPVVSAEAVIVDAGSRPDALVRAPAVYVELGARPGARARVAAVELAGFRAR